ncbi:MAG: TolC family protein [Chitinophagaceae bacterium]
MLRRKTINYTVIALLAVTYSACKTPVIQGRTASRSTPETYSVPETTDSTSAASLTWKQFFSDPYLAALIDTALHNNQELNITLQEIQISKNEIRARKGEYLPFVGVKAGMGVDKVARYTNIGAMEANTEIKPGKEMPEPLGDFGVAAYATWEADIWHKLRNATKAAALRYLATVEGKNFMVTNLIAEISSSYFELLALDNQLAILQQNISLQENALKVVRLQKEATRVTELAVRRFEAQLLSTQSMQYTIQQQIVETENRINFLCGRFPGRVNRSTIGFDSLVPAVVYAGLPAQLLANRPDIRKAEQELEAARLDVQVARARFYPSLGISAAVGYRAFNPAYLVKTPESLLYSLAGDLAAPLVNRNAIKAAYYSANAKQVQAAFGYEQTILNAYTEVYNQLSKISNLEKTYALRSKQVEALAQSVDISNNLFTSARADYMEVLLTQRDALEAKFDLVETRIQQLNAAVSVYRSLGGGWK